MLTGVPHPHRSRASPEEAGRVATTPSAPCGACTTLFGGQRGAGVVGVRGTKTSWPASVPAPPDRSCLRPGSAAEGKGGCWKMTRPSGSSRVVRSYRGLSGAAKLVASDGRMNVPNERRAVESDEETFMDQHGRSLHLVGSDVLHEQERSTIRCVMALPGLLNRRSPRVPSGSISPRWERHGFGGRFSSS
jgi:hypothetical protein